MSDPQNNYVFGMVGLGTMGRNLLLNMGDHGIRGAGYDKDAAKSVLLEKESVAGNLKGFSDIKAFVNSLQSPRAIMMLVPAGKIVDSVIEDLLPLLSKGDILIDGGNSHFTDTDRRVGYLQSHDIHFFGMGISGGEEGARYGPSMMPGGDKEAYNVMRPVLDAIAARVDGEPCVTYIGPGASGHFVKMVHNGIEYGMMQLIAETYGLLRNGLHLDNAAIRKIFSSWNSGRLQSFLLEITVDIFSYSSPGTDHLLLDDIKDEAKAKGTGKWTSQVAMDIELPIPTIDTAVSSRHLSEYKSLRENLSDIYSGQKAAMEVDTDLFISGLEEAFYFSMIITYAQGMHLLSRASAAYSYNLQLAGIARIWRGGCIIRSSFLNDIYNAFQENNALEHLLLDETVSGKVIPCLHATREVLSKAVNAGHAMPAFLSALGYFEAIRNSQLPSNLIQAQRDYFGAHTYELTGQQGSFHTQWSQKQSDDVRQP